MIYIAFDTETHVAAHVSPMVCMSLYGYGMVPACLVGVPQHSPTSHIEDSPHGWGALLTGALAVEVYRVLLTDPEVTLVGQNVSFDLGVLAQAAYTLVGTDGAPPEPLLDETFSELMAGRIRCTRVREQLIAIALDRMRWDVGLSAKPVFSLAEMAQKYLFVDRSAEKGKAAKCEACGALEVPAANCPDCQGYGWVGPWRMRYCQLHGVDLQQWPQDALRYALNDAEDTLRVFSEQSQVEGETPVGSIWASREGEYATLTDEIKQTQRAFALDLMTIWAVNVDADAAAELKEEVAGIVAKADAMGVVAGFIRDARGVARLRPGDKPSKPGSLSKVALQDLVVEACGAPADLDPDDLTEWLDAEGLLTKPSKTFPLGQVKTDRRTLIGSGSRVLMDYAEAGHARTVLRTFLPQVEKAIALGGPLTSRANVLVATGRVSWGQPNLTNPPRAGGFRECFVARPGWVFLATDYDTAELCGLAQILIWLGFGETMAEAIRQGQDLHIKAGAELLGITYEEGMRLKAAGDPRMKVVRDLAKAENFGFMGGMGAAAFVTFAAGYGISVEDIIVYAGEVVGPNPRTQAIEVIKRLKKAWLRAWPEMVQYFKWVGQQTEDGRFTYKQWASGRLRGGVGFCDGCNTGPQGMIADGAKQAAWNVTVECYTGYQVDAQGAWVRDADGQRVPSALAGCRSWLFMHDEILLEAPYRNNPAKLTAAADRMAQVMTEAMQAHHPDVPSRAETAAMLRWYKGAKPVRNADGHLVPWAPKPKPQPELSTAGVTP